MMLSKEEVRKVIGSYTAWRSTKDRCLNPRNHAYADYGGRGIKVCARWSEFENFWEDMGPRPTGMSLDRINCDGDYEPGNCRWASKLEQANNKRNNIWITAHGERKTITQWARDTGLKDCTIRRRFRDLGWSPEESVRAGKRSGGDRHSAAYKAKRLA